jgi:Holliday junction resolvase-like predicted endonuclease
MKVKKSSAHRKITGNFAENLVAYWLSKYGFECANVDHTGIDIIARNPNTKEIMGISVKGRSRNEGKEGTSVSIRNDNFDKIEKACKDFACVPYFAIVADEKDKIYVFILSGEKLLRLFPKGETACSWKMNEKHIREYYDDPEIKIFEFNYKTHSWWK